MVREGDVVVFDGDKEHAWFCSGRAHFVTVLVTKKRKQKGDIVGLPVPRK
jgi:quercetin dioxygenase-like cupin family protein